MYKNILAIYNRLFSFFDQLKFRIYEITKLRIERKNYNLFISKKNPTIDIILPTYNRSQMLKERSIPSVLKQTYKNFKLIIIGDCCTDDTDKVIENFNDNRIFFKNLEKRKKRYPPTIENHWFAGPVVPINEGLKYINADWICRIDDDDIWTDDHLEILLKHVLETKSEFVSSSYISYINEKKVLKNFEDEKPAIGGVQTWLYINYLKFFKANINCWRRNWHKVNDADLQDRMHKAGVKMSYINKVTAIIIPRPGDKIVGIKAYKEKENYYLKQYEFSND